MSTSLSSDPAANVQYVCRLFSLPNPLSCDKISSPRVGGASGTSSNGRAGSSDSKNSFNSKCGTLDCWSLGEALFQRAKLERDCRARLVFLDACLAFYSSAKSDPSLTLTSSLQNQLQRDIDKATIERGKTIKAIDDYAKMQQHKREWQIKHEVCYSDALVTTSFDDQYNQVKGAATCAGCAEPILQGTVLHELGREWHAPCFILRHICAHCGRSIAADPRGYVVGDAIRGSFDKYETDDKKITTRPVFHAKCYPDALTGLERVVSMPKRCFGSRVTLTNRHVNPGGTIFIHISIDATDQHGFLIHRHVLHINYLELRLVCCETFKTTCETRAKKLQFWRTSYERRQDQMKLKSTCKKTVVDKVFNLLDGQIPNNHLIPIHADSTIEYVVPATVKRTHVHDPGYAREYELHVRVHFTMVYNRAVDHVFNIVVLGDRLEDNSNRAVVQARGRK